jgi:lipopolysaccharide heptosyltransferase I
MSLGIDPAGLRRILIVRMSSLGDVVQSVPVATALRRRHPAARITWAIESRFAELLDGHPAIDRLVRFPAMEWRGVGRGWMQNFRSAVESLRAESYDVAIDLQSLAKSSLVALLSRAPLRVGHPWQREGAGLVSRAVKNPANAHVVEQYLACAAALGASSNEVAFDLPVRAAARARVSEMLGGRGAGNQALIVLNPSTSKARKCWSVERWIEVAQALADAGDLAFIGSAAEVPRHHEIARRSGIDVVDFTGRTTLSELVALLDRSALHVGHDTGTSQIAAALGIPAVSIFGPTDPRRAAPWGQTHRALKHEGLCAPTCPRFCPYRRRCLAAVSVEEVVGLARSAL